jgi:pyruvate,water dikinase
MVYAEGDTPVKNIDVADEDRLKYVVTDDEILQLAKWAVIIEDHYDKPMDIEWAKDGDGVDVGTGKLFIVQARPETVHSRKDLNVIRTYVLKEQGTVLVEGLSVGDKIGQGEANIIHSADDIVNFKPGQVLVTDMTDPDWEPIMKIASAIVTNRGGRTCHAAIVSRELGIPAVIGTETGTEMIRHGASITVSCVDETGKVYDGLLEFEVQETDLETIPSTKTKIMMNLAIPEQAFTQGQLPNDGVGLARRSLSSTPTLASTPLPSSTSTNSRSAQHLTSASPRR